MLFAENLGVYRRAYEYAAKIGHDDVARVAQMRKFFETIFKP